MHKHCVKTVFRLVKSLVKLTGLSSGSTAMPKYLTSQVFFVPIFNTAHEQHLSVFEHGNMVNSYPFLANLSPTPTLPNNEAINLI
jgi:hypothetical protein